MSNLQIDNPEVHRIRKHFGPRPGWMLRAMMLIMIFSAAAWAGDKTFELRGEIEPAYCTASVAMYGVSKPIVILTNSDSQGLFRFKKVTPGLYSVMVKCPNTPEVNRFVDVTKSFADSKGRVHFTIALPPAERSSMDIAGASYVVSVRELKIPGKARKQYQKALKALNNGDGVTAHEHLERAVELAPGFVAAWNHLGVLEGQQGHMSKAEQYFRQALRHDSQSFAPLLNLGGALLDLGKCKDALEYNKGALRKRPMDAEANSQLGKNYFCLGDDEEAIKYLVKAKTIDPHLASFPQFDLARVYLSQGNDEAVLLELNEFLQRHPDLPEAQQTREWISNFKTKINYTERAQRSDK
jgi:tetratricopeptide (TPR) repeat protein